MAIKVNGTTVIDNSRNFTNIAGGFKTVNGTSVVGSGDISAGASTTWGAVGTYTLAGIQGGSGDHSGGDTLSGSVLKLNQKWVSALGTQTESIYPNYYWASNTLSGTWRVMVNNAVELTATGSAAATFMVRIS